MHAVPKLATSLPQGALTSETLPSLGLPLSLSRLRRAKDGTEHDDAWTEFVRAHSDVVLHACRAIAHDHDSAMDSYAFVLEELHGNGCRRLHAYVPDGKTKFTTWLVVVTRRLALDLHRQRYGRPRSGDESRRTESIARRNLEDLVAAEIDPDQIEPSTASSPDDELRRRELRDTLARAIAELDPPDRLLLALRFVDEQSIRDIARALGFPSVFHVYRRVAGLLSTLRKVLASRGVEGSEP